MELRAYFPIRVVADGGRSIGPVLWRARATNTKLDERGFLRAFGITVRNDNWCFREQPWVDLASFAGIAIAGISSRTGSGYSEILFSDELDAFLFKVFYG